MKPGWEGEGKEGHWLDSSLPYWVHAFSLIVHTNRSFRTWEPKENSLKGYAEFYKSYCSAPCAISFQAWTTFIELLTNVSSCVTFHAVSFFITHFCLISCVMLKVHQKKNFCLQMLLNPKRESRDLNSNYMVKAKFDVHNEKWCDFDILIINICDPILKISILCHKLTLTHYITEVSRAAHHILTFFVVIIIMIASNIYWALSLEGSWYYVHYMHSLFKSF